MQLRSVFAVTLSLFSIGPPLTAAHQPGSPTANKPTSVAIIELFTSEGCSSCPPADALPQQIHLKQVPSGQIIVDAEKSIHLSLPDGFQVAAGSGHHLVLFVQEAHQGVIMGAATASL